LNITNTNYLKQPFTERSVRSVERSLNVVERSTTLRKIYK